MPKATTVTDIIDQGNDQWAVRYRPTDMGSFVCHEYIRNQVEAFVERPPNAVLITGDFGCGKTTLARIIANMLTNHAEDIHEINGVTDSGVDNVRSLIQTALFRPRGKRRVFIIDEAHALSPQAVQAFLKPMEDAKARVTWIICTNQPHKLNAAMMSRCRNLALSSPSVEQLDELLTDIASKEKVRSYPGFVLLKKKDADAAKKMLRLLRKSAINASGKSPRVAITNYQSLCSLLFNPAKKDTAQTLGAKLKDAAQAMTSGIEASVDNILDLLHKEPGEAAAALINARDLSLFNKLFYAARDSVAANKKSELATKVLLYCTEAVHWAAFANMNPSIYLATKMSMWAVNIKHREQASTKPIKKGDK